MDITSSRAQASRMIKRWGSSCVLTKPDGETLSTVGIVLTADSEKKSSDDYISSTERSVYLPGTISTTPENGDSITFKTELYIVKSVRSYAVGEGNRNVIAYQCVVGV